MWHDHHAIYQACGSWGSVACAAVACHLLRLPQEQIKHALGIAEYHAPKLPMMWDIDHPAMVKHGIGWGAMNGIVSAQPQLLSQGQRRREELRARMPLRVQGAIVKVQAVGRIAVGEGGANGQGPLAMQQDGGFVTRPGFDGVVGCEATDGGQRADQRGPQDVQQGHAGLALHFSRERVPRGVSDELSN